eukprot:2110339-Pyramimonas_sp.AAC.1
MEGSLHLARCDESNAFSSVVTPSRWRPWAATPALPSVLARSQPPPELPEAADGPSPRSARILAAISVKSLGEILNFNR